MINFHEVLFSCLEILGKEEENDFPSPFLLSGLQEKCDQLTFNDRVKLLGTTNDMLRAMLTESNMFFNPFKTVFLQQGRSKY